MHSRGGVDLGPAASFVWGRGWYNWVFPTQFLSGGIPFDPT